jgi:hypothetical protein
VYRPDVFSSIRSADAIAGELNRLSMATSRWPSLLEAKHPTSAPHGPATPVK